VANRCLLIAANLQLFWKENMVYAPKFANAFGEVRINLYSDTQTRPTAPMKAAMFAAEVGDEQLGTDPTVLALCERVAQLLGKEAALFLPSGTMCNQISVATHCRPGEELLAHESAHVTASEGGGPWAISGVGARGVGGDRGQFDVDALEKALRPRNRSAPLQSLVVVEQTSTRGAGSVWSLELMAEVAQWAHDHQMRTHIDGARLMNAAVALDVPASRLTVGYDSVWLDFTKGLGAPFGAVLAGSADFIDNAWRWKQRLGGSMRQAGFAAAACLYALDHHVDRLADDHANAHRLGVALAKVPGITIQEPETNQLFFNVEGTGWTAEDFAIALRRAGVFMAPMSHSTLRACTHLDVSQYQIDETAQIISDLSGSRSRPSAPG
jgi:threonine aldolase